MLGSALFPKGVKVTLVEYIILFCIAVCKQVISVRVAMSPGFKFKLEMLIMTANNRLTKTNAKYLPT